MSLLLDQFAGPLRDRHLAMPLLGDRIAATAVEEVAQQEHAAFGLHMLCRRSPG
ncbi:MAG: hypothetical protein IPK26_13650 [Planctomycetes bacterium]|nr:hypothetical protein [Planctomycetota bacterium]